MSSNGRCFDIGGTVHDALQRYEQKGESFSGTTDPQSAGNGFLMRLAPVVLFSTRTPKRLFTMPLRVHEQHTVHKRQYMRAGFSPASSQKPLTVSENQDC